MSTQAKSQADVQTARQLLRHSLATLAYRGGKAVRNAPTDFDCFQVAQGARTPGKILAHVCDLMDWGLSMAKGEPVWKDSEPTWWEQDVQRFHAAITAFDDYLGSDLPLYAAVENLLQGPVADALTHVGQLTMLRRLAGDPIKGENYYKADIKIGRVGADQPAPRREFE